MNKNDIFREYYEQRYAPSNPDFSYVPFEFLFEDEKSSIRNTISFRVYLFRIKIELFIIELAEKLEK
jgi:hypothetical protein